MADSINSCKNNDTNGDNLKLHTLHVDSDFKRLCPEPTPEEYAALEKELICKGCRRPVEIWHDMILYDFTVYDICIKWGIPFSIIKTSFPTKYDAIYYTCRKLLNDNTRHHSDIYYRYLIGRAFNAMKKVMADVQYGRRECPYPLPDTDGENRGRRSLTSIIAGNIFHLSSCTISIYGSYAKALDTINDKVPSAAEEIFKKHISFGMDSTIKLAQCSNAEILMECEKLKRNGFRPVDNNPRPGQKKSGEIKMKPKNNGPEIKQTPKYDPDAELSSLTLTIPSWIGSMKRTQSVANFKKASPKAIQKLENRLFDLTAEISEMLAIIKENTTNGE